MFIWKCHCSYLNMKHAVIVWTKVLQEWQMCHVSKCNSIMEIVMISNNGKLNCFSKTFWQRVTAVKCKITHRKNYILIDRKKLCLGNLGIKTMTYGTNTLPCLFMSLYNALNSRPSKINHAVHSCEPNKYRFQCHTSDDRKKNIKV